MLADRTMESYRGKQFTDIAAGTTTTTYTGVTSPPSPDGRTYNVNSVVTSTAATNTTGANARSIKVIVVTVADAAGRTGSPNDRRSKPSPADRPQRSNIGSRSQCALEGPPVCLVPSALLPS